MKRSFRIYACTALLPLMLLGSGCNDWLDVKPQRQVESEDLFSKEGGFEDALIACYIKMNNPGLYGQNLSMTFIEYLAQHWDFSSGNGRTAALIKNFEYTTSEAESSISSIYGAMYNVIVQANGILESLEIHAGMFETPGIRDMVEAEALGVRAFCHFDILRLFGQLPQNATVQVQLPYAREVTTGTIPYYPYDQFVDLIFDDLNAAQALLAECDPVLDYIIRLVNATRSHPMIAQGASPRASLALAAMAKAAALLFGRDYVNPEDVSMVFADVVTHRLILSPRAEASGSFQPAAELLRQVPPPKIG